MKLFLSPHNDDEVLWSTFTLLREKPTVVVVYDGYAQQSRGANITARQRRQETEQAMAVLGIEDVRFLGFSDDAFLNVQVLLDKLKTIADPSGYDEVYVPLHEDDGHTQHNIVSTAGFVLEQNGMQVTRYATYTRNGGKQRTENEVIPQDGEWIRLKHLALASYKSQYNMGTNPPLGCWPWFMTDLREYYE